MSKNFNTNNPDCLTYKNELLQLTVLGGIKIDGLDRMRVTLKVELVDSPQAPIRHNLDLYNDIQLEKFIRKIAERLEIGTSVISASLSELIEQLESYRLSKLKEQTVQADPIKVLSPKEKEEAEKYLQETNLIERTTQDLTDSGIVGESINSLILYLAMSSRKCADPLSVICLAKSGMGKSYLMEKVGACFPTEDILENTQFTENSFYYFKREEIRGKIFLIEDLDGAQAVMYPIRELQSKKRISKTVTLKDKNGQMRTVNLIVEGPVSIVGCTTKEQIYEDNANRSILLYIDNTKEQDVKILEYQKKIKAGLIDTGQEKQVQIKLQNLQRILEPIKIVNPYALLINLPKEVFKPRRTMGLLLNFIEAITYYHQKQREQLVVKDTGEIYIETNPEDIEFAFKLLRETLFRKSDELSGACRSFYEYLKNWVKINKEKEEDKKFASNEIRQQNRIHPRTLNRYLQELVAYNYVEVVGGSKYKGYSYQLNLEIEEKDLQTVIDQQLQGVLAKVCEFEKTKTVRHSQSKPKSKLANSTT